LLLYNKFALVLIIECIHRDVVALAFDTFDFLSLSLVVFHCFFSEKREEPVKKTTVSLMAHKKAYNTCEIYFYL